MMISYTSCDSSAILFEKNGLCLWITPASSLLTAATRSKKKCMQLGAADAYAVACRAREMEASEEKH